MKTNCTYAISPETNTPLVPGEMIRGGSSILKSVIDIMALWGIERIEANPESYGQLTLAAPKFRSFTKTEVPPWVVKARKQAMNYLGNFIFLSGIAALEIDPSPEEMAQIKGRWKACEDSFAEGQGKEKESENAGPEAAPAGSPAGSPQSPVN